MKDIVSLQLSEVLDLQPFLMAGCVLIGFDQRLYSFERGEDPFVVVDPAGEAHDFPSVIDAWCFFSGRVHKCEQCDGGWIDARAVTLVEAFVEGAAVKHGTMKRPCGLCGGFGMLTEKQLEIVNEAKRRALDFMEDFND